MMNRSVHSMILSLALGAGAVAQKAPLEVSAGQSLAAIAGGKTGISYTVYTPKSYQPKAAPGPILITFSPGGNGEGIVNKLKDGIEKAGWTLVGCDKLRNGMKDRELALEMEREVLDDILQRVPHDPQRIYLGGFSGGAMRAYDLTTRRSEPIAGILAYGGWLGGPDHQDEAYREGMSVAMLNGLRDKGAGGWMPIDTRTLQKRDCRVKHFAFEGGHGVAPPQFTETAVAWLEEEWRRKSESGSGKAKPLADGGRSPLHVLYVGKPGPRADDFSDFLSEYFRKVSVVEPDQCTLEQANLADVLVLDAVVRSLPEGCTKAMLMTGSSAALTGERYGSKIDWLCQCLDHEAYAVDLSHPVFDGPLAVTPTLVEKRCPHSGLKIQAWKVEEPQETPGLVSSRRHFEFAEDSEIISGGVNMKGVHGVPLLREAHRLLWGFVAPPSEMSEEARRVFINSLLWIHSFDGHQQVEFAGIHERQTVTNILNSPYVSEENLIRWFPAEVIEESKGDKDEIKKYFEGRMDYVFVPSGGGQLRVDEDAARLGTPNYDPESLSKWIGMLDGDEADLGYKLLLRYTGKRFRKKPAQWKKWLEMNEDALVFSDREGYRFVAMSDRSETNREFGKLLERRKGADLELTEQAPILFDRALVGPSAGMVPVIDGVAHQRKGRKVRLMVRARVKEGWHFYSATEDNGTNIPTTIEVDLPEGMSFAGEWKFPEAVDGKLGDGVIFEREINVGPKPLDRVEIDGVVHFQACTEAKCLQPQSLDFTLPLTVTGKKSKAE